MRKSRIVAVLAIVACLGVFTGSALAQDKDIVIPLTLQDFTGKHKIEVNFPMLPGDGYFGMPIILTGQLGLGNMSLGLNVPLVMYAPDEGDTEFTLGSPTIDFKVHMCSGGEWSMCYGGGIAVGAGFLDVDSVGVFAAHAVGVSGSQDPSLYSPESLIMRPLGFFAVTNGGIVAQAEFGAAIQVPIIDTEGKDSVEAALMYQFMFGYTLADLVTPMIEFRGMTPVTQDNIDTYLWLNFGARGHFGPFEPVFRLAVPVSDEAKANSDVHIELGCAIVF